MLREIKPTILTIILSLNVLSCLGQPANPDPSKLAWVPPGTFILGSPESELGRTPSEGPQTTVTLSRGFWIGKHEVTQAEYQSVTGQNPSAFQGDVRRPVENVTWDEAVAYCVQLTGRESRLGRLPDGYWYRLPTEAEWEYACRAGTTTRYSFGDDLGSSDCVDYAWHADNASQVPHPVGTKKPNPWGLYDMHGNVFEWCQDCHGAYPGGQLTDPQGPSTGDTRSIRGGDFTVDCGWVRSAARNTAPPDARLMTIGFRVVLAEADGAKPDSFNPQALGRVNCTAVHADGSIWVGGTFDSLAGQTRHRIAWLGEDGTLEGASDLAADYDVNAILVQTDQRVLVGGVFLVLGGQSRSCIGRLMADGTLDSSFNPGADAQVFTLAQQADGKILVGGGFTRIAGQQRSRIARLNADGTLDNTFTPPAANRAVYSIAVQVDGKVLVGGYFNELGGRAQWGIARLNADGTIDASFDPKITGPSNHSGVYAVVVQPDGKILIGGVFTAIGGMSRANLGRLNADGTPDLNFNPGANSGVYSIALQTDGKILVGGYFNELHGMPRWGIGRLHANGTLDESVNPSALANVRSLALQVDGKILVGGDFHTLGAQTRHAIGRLYNTSPATQDLTVNGATITWYRAGSSPEVWRTVFDVSTNGTKWLTLGAGQRVDGGWQLSNASVSGNVAIRARGLTTCGEHNGSGGCVEASLLPPLISSQPQSQSSHVGGTVGFQVAVVNTLLPMAYQWQKQGSPLTNGGRIRGATSAALTISDLKLPDTGDYSVVITNRLGSVTSQGARLTVFGDAPIITSPLVAMGKQGATFTYAITASNEPTGFVQSGLPAGLSLNGTSGVISGIPKVSGSFAVSITASNPWGSDTKILALALASGVPSITSALTASGKQGATFTYAIAASNEPTGFAQSGLPLGLSLDTTSGVISGIPQISGSFAVSITASNPWGSDTKILALALASGVPSITSALAASGKQGVAFTYAIAASNEPTGFAQSGLPAGLSLNTTSGVISGIPQVSGSFAVSLSVSNQWGSDTKILTLVLTSGVPVITGSMTANGKQGVAFSYAVRADHNPTGFTAADLPSGLEIDGTTGVISGRPLAGGTFSSTITATNNYGADTRTLVITVASSVPVITSVTTVSGQEGQTFSYTIQATESPAEFGADGLPAGLSVSAGTGAISGKPMYGGKQEVVIWARNAWGTGSNTLVLNLAYAAIGGLSIGDVTNYYSSPYLVDFEFSLRDNDDPMVGHAVVRSCSDLKVVCREDGRSISPTETAFVVEPRNRKQLKSYLVLDYTASMQFGAPDTDGDGVSDAIENMEAAAKTFISQQPAESQYGVYEFHREDRAPVRISRFTSDKTALRAAIDGILAKEIKSWFAGSRCWDALAAAVKEFGPPNRDEQRYVVFLSDGRDESSTNATPAQIVTAARERGVKLYCVAFGSEIDTATLQLLTGETRGRYYVASGAGDLSAQFAQVGKDLDGQYLLRWATLKQGSAPFRPSFEVTVDGKTAAFNTNLALPSRVPDYVPTENAGDRLAGALRLVADAEDKPMSVTLRAAYVPRYIRNLRLHYRANYPCTTRLRSAATGEILNGWNLKESEDGQGGKWLELTSPSPADLKTSIRYGAMGNLVRFDFTELRSAQDAFSVFEVDNAIYLETGGQSFALENAGQFITVMQPTPHGTPPNWLAARGFTGDLVAAEMSDPDRDGLLTWQEYRAGTDPRDQASSLVIRPAGQGGAPFHVAFSSVAGKHYRVETTVDFDVWQVVQGGLVGTGGSMVVTDTRPLAGARQVYYRLVVE